VLDGDLTIKGTTRPLSLLLEVCGSSPLPSANQVVAGLRRSRWSDLSPQFGWARAGRR